MLILIKHFTRNYVSGIKKNNIDKILSYRKANGKISSREEIKKKKLLKTHEMIYDSLIKKDIETLNAAIDEHYDIIEELLG